MPQSLPEYLLDLPERIGFKACAMADTNNLGLGKWSELVSPRSRILTAQAQMKTKNTTPQDSRRKYYPLFPGVIN